MPLLGSIVNSLTVVVGSLFGFLLKKGIPEKMNQTILQGLALGVLVNGISEGMKTENLIIVFGSLVVGGVIGEFIDIEERLNHLGDYFEKKFKNKEGNVAQAFVSSSLVFCIGSMAIMGALQSGLQNDHSTLYVKSMIDGVASIIFSSTLGIGVILSAGALLFYQGGITLLASFVKPLLAVPVVREMTAVGGILLIGISLNMLGLTKIRLGNLLPGMFIPIIIYLIYPFV